MYEDSLLEMAYEDRFYYEGDDDLDEVDDCEDGHDLRWLDDDRDQCAECGTIVYL